MIRLKVWNGKEKMSKPNNQNAVKHGGAGAMNAIQNNRDFTGLAKDALDDVESRIGLNGVQGELVRNASRLQAVSDLYFAAWSKVVQDGDIEKITSFLKVWNWTTNSAQRAWQAVAKVMKPDAIKDVLDAYEKLKDGDGGQ